MNVASGLYNLGVLHLYSISEQHLCRRAFVTKMALPVSSTGRFEFFYHQLNALKFSLLHFGMDFLFLTFIHEHYNYNEPIFASLYDIYVFLFLLYPCRPILK